MQDKKGAATGFLLVAFVMLVVTCPVAGYMLSVTPTAKEKAIIGLAWLMVIGLFSGLVVQDDSR